MRSCASAMRASGAAGAEAWIEALGRPAAAAPAADFTPTFAAPEDRAREGYGLFWWSVGAGDGPPDVYARGLFGQVLFVSRARGVVASSVVVAC